MPRLQPPAGYLTAKDAAARLGVTDGLLSRYVQQGKLRRYGPAERKHKFYKESEVEALVQSSRIFVEEYQMGDYQKNPVSFFGPAQAEDLPAILAIRSATFRIEGGANQWEWLQRNPEVLYSLKNQIGEITGYACIMPLQMAIVDKLIHDEIRMNEFRADDIDIYTPGMKTHLFIIALAIDPRYSTKERRTYGARLVSGLFTLLLDLASRGIEVETITARSYHPDGNRLLRKTGMPQLRSPVEGKNLYRVNVAESGFPLFVHYSKILEKWKSEHQQLEE